MTTHRINNNNEIDCRALRKRCHLNEIDLAIRKYRFH